MYAALLSLFLAQAAPAPAPVPRADVEACRHVYFGGRWYEVAIDFRARLYTCPSPACEHSAWTGEVESWDARTGTVVFREAYVTCKPDGLPESGAVSLVRLRFHRGADGRLLADAEGGSWGRCEVELR